MIINIFQALRHLLKAAQLVPDDDKAITYAIDTVASSKDEKLVNQLIDFLLGGDGLPKVVIIITYYSDLEDIKHLNTFDLFIKYIFI